MCFILFEPTQLTFKKYYIHSENSHILFLISFVPYYIQFRYHSILVLFSNRVVRLPNLTKSMFEYLLLQVRLKTLKFKRFVT